MRVGEGQVYERAGRWPNTSPCSIGGMQASKEEPPYFTLPPPECSAASSWPQVGLSPLSPAAPPLARYPSREHARPVRAGSVSSQLQHLRPWPPGALPQAEAGAARRAGGSQSTRRQLPGATARGGRPAARRHRHPSGPPPPAGRMAAAPGSLPATHCRPAWAGTIRPQKQHLQPLAVVRPAAGVLQQASCGRRPAAGVLQQASCSRRPAAGVLQHAEVGRPRQPRATGRLPLPVHRSAAFHQAATPPAALPCSRARRRPARPGPAPPGSAATLTSPAGQPLRRAATGRRPRSRCSLLLPAAGRPAPAASAAGPHGRPPLPACHQAAAAARGRCSCKHGGPAHRRPIGPLTPA